MTSSELKALFSDLFTILLCSFCLEDYSDYLDESNKKMKLHHLSTVPYKQLTDNLSLSFLPVTELWPSKLDVNMAMSSAEDFKQSRGKLKNVGEAVRAQLYTHSHAHALCRYRPRRVA